MWVIEASRPHSSNVIAGLAHGEPGNSSRCQKAEAGSSPWMMGEAGINFIKTRCRVGNESIQRSRLRLRKLNPELGAPPQYIVCGSGEFFRDEVAHFGFRQCRAESHAEVGGRPGAGQNAFRSVAVGGGKPACL
jgi:hypothetical protein